MSVRSFSLGNIKNTNRIKTLNVANIKKSSLVKATVLRRAGLIF
jgi:hypothetical protein